MRLTDFLKQQQITALFTSLLEGGKALENSQLGVSSLMDTWLLLRNTEYNGERNRTLFVLKSRGMAHSNQVREFVLSSAGIDLVDVYLGSDGVVTGSARMTQEAHEQAAAVLRRHEHEKRLRELAAKRKALEAQIAALQLEAESAAAEAELAVAQEKTEADAAQIAAQALAERRGGNHR
jgi:circadian clock protein KaiC